MKNNKLKIIGFSQILESFHGSRFTPPWLSVVLENFLSCIRGKRVRFSFDNISKLISATDLSDKYFFENRGRGFSIYRNGLKARGAFLSKTYCLDVITFTKDDIVIDCGANSGDLFLHLDSKIEPQNYLAVEPSIRDFQVLEKNVLGAKLLNIALGDVNDEVDFYLSVKGADSSVIEPKNWTEKTKTPIRRLDSLIGEMKIAKVKLLKVEAEGFEPEVLQGSFGALNLIEFIAIDGGPERGVSESQTFSDCTNFLLQNGFRMVDTYLPWNRALFRNASFYA